MEQTLVDRVEITSEQFLNDLRDPSIRLLLIGEQHGNRRFLQNQFRILKHLHEHGRDYQLALEHFDSSNEQLFHEFHRKRDKAGLMEKVKSVYDATYKLMQPALEFSLDMGKQILPVSIPDDGESYIRDSEKETHIAEKLNLHAYNSPRDRVTVLFIGTSHLLNGNRLIPNLVCRPEERTIVLQHPDYFKKILRVPVSEGKRYELNVSL